MSSTFAWTLTRRCNSLSFFNIETETRSRSGLVVRRWRIRSRSMFIVRQDKGNWLLDGTTLVDVQSASDVIHHPSQHNYKADWLWEITRTSSRGGEVVPCGSGLNLIRDLRNNAQSLQAKEDIGHDTEFWKYESTNTMKSYRKLSQQCHISILFCHSCWADRITQTISTARSHQLVWMFGSVRDDGEGSWMLDRAEHVGATLIDVTDATDIIHHGTGRGGYSTDSYMYVPPILTIIARTLRVISACKQPINVNARLVKQRDGLESDSVGESGTKIAWYYSATTTHVGPVIYETWCRYDRLWLHRAGTKRRLPGGIFMICGALSRMNWFRDEVCTSSRLLTCLIQTASLTLLVSRPRSDLPILSWICNPASFFEDNGRFIALGNLAYASYRQVYFYESQIPISFSLLVFTNIASSTASCTLNWTGITLTRYDMIDQAHRTTTNWDDIARDVNEVIIPCITLSTCNWCSLRFDLLKMRSWYPFDLYFEKLKPIYHLLGERINEYPTAPRSVRHLSPDESRKQKVSEI